MTEEHLGSVAFTSTAPAVTEAPADGSNDSWWQTGNGTATQEPFVGAYEILGMLWISVPTILTYGITFIVGTLGNALVLFCTVRFKRLRAATTYYLASLAAADLIICSVCVPIRTAEYFLPQWELGLFMCKAVAFVQLLSVVCSVLTLTAISIERYYAILHPMKAKSICTLGRTRKIMAGVWIVAIILSSPILYGQTLRGFVIAPNLTVYHCQPVWPSLMYRQVYIVYGALVIFVLPFIVMVYTYGRICRTLWVSSKLLDVMTQGQAGHHQHVQQRLQLPSMRLMVSTRGNNSHSTSFRGRSAISHDNGSTSPWQRPKPTVMPPRRCTRLVNRNLETFREQQGRKQLIKMLIVVISLFALCWAPILTLNVLKVFNLVNPHTPEVYYMAIAFQLMGYVNSCVNPLCYAFMSKNFRQVYLRTLGWPCDAYQRMSSCTSTSSSHRRTLATKMTFLSESHISPNRDTGPPVQMESTL